MKIPDFGMGNPLLPGFSGKRAAEPDMHSLRNMRMRYSGRCHFIRKAVEQGKQKSPRIMRGLFCCPAW
ncbi:MAG: hypothetical protein DSY57_05440 [Desulfobulbus sp.]|nr:MAG: hypothetical protein DSY57_05440 [Desulfobulbus sp.]